MRIEDCYEFGYIARTHGYQGQVVLVLDVDNPAAYEGLESLFVLIREKLIPYFVEDIRLQGQNAVVKLEDIHSQEEAQELVGSALYLPLESLPKLAEGQFYYHDIVGYRVVDVTRGALGTVTTVYDMPHHDILVMHYQEKEVLIPVNDEVVLQADHEKKQVTVNLPDGLLELYTSEPEDETEPK